MQETGTPKPGGLSWLSSVTSLMAVIACYGTLGAVALLSVLGVSVDLNEGALVAIITVLLILAVAGMVYSYRIHRNPGPLILGGLAAGVLIWVFYGAYSVPVEFAGFVGLVGSSIWDIRAKKRACVKP